MTIPKFSRSVSTLACMGAFALMSSAVNAAPMVTQWSYSTNAQFLSATFSAGTTNNTVSDYELSWGNPDGDFQNPVTDFNLNRSALTIGSGDGSGEVEDRIGGGPVTGLVNTTFDGALPDPLLGQIGLGVTFTHWNNPISSLYSSLTGGVVRDTITLRGVLPNPDYPDDTIPDEEGSINFTFRFSETPNNPAGGCAGGTPEPCADLFSIVGFETINDPFIYGGNTYFASIFVLGAEGAASPIAQLFNAECSALGLQNGCLGFRTAERAQTTATFAFAISAERLPFNDVPEPGTLALLGLGLAGLGVIARRRKV